MIQAPPKSIDICVCTFRRPQLATTLDSLVQLVLPDAIKVRILVADNDASPSAQTLVENYKNAAVPVQYIHAPKQNISMARNACLDHATGDLIAWIDDDETAAKDWLIQLLDRLQDGDFAAVFGPAIAIYPPDAPAHIVRADFHSNRAVVRGGQVRTGHSCNALVDMRDPTTRALRFDIAKGRTGGEDTDYFHRMWAAGATLGVCETAQVFEKVAPGRLRLSWLIRRSFNSGNIFGELSRRGVAMIAVPGLVAAALAKASYCFAVALVNCASAMKRLWWLRRGVMHLGVIAGLARIRPKAQY
ncbi:MAG: glycosyltransferase [Marinosulfonomonas sp.]|nr:glycosyltransferase [Marinosulfonomonas sp.]